MLLFQLCNTPSLAVILCVNYYYAHFLAKNARYKCSIKCAQVRTLRKEVLHLQYQRIVRSYSVPLAQNDPMCVN